MEKHVSGVEMGVAEGPYHSMWEDDLARELDRPGFQFQLYHP